MLYCFIFSSKRWQQLQTRTTGLIPLTLCFVKKKCIWCHFLYHTFISVRYHWCHIIIYLTARKSFGYMHVDCVIFHSNVVYFPKLFDLFSFSCCYNEPFESIAKKLEMIHILGIRVVRKFCVIVKEFVVFEIDLPEILMMNCCCFSKKKKICERSIYIYNFLFIYIVECLLAIFY